MLNEVAIWWAIAFLQLIINWAKQILQYLKYYIWNWDYAIFQTWTSLDSDVILFKLHQLLFFKYIYMF